MKDFQKMGGVAALIEAATYLVGIGVLFTLLAPIAGGVDPAKYLAFLANNQIFMHLWILLIYVVNGIFLVVLVLALYDRLKAGSPAMAQTATAFGLIWAGLVIASGMLMIHDLGVVGRLYGKDPAQAVTVWVTLSAVEDALGGGIELPGGLWILLVSWAALRAGGLPKALNYLGALIGVAGILMVAPALDVLSPVFGLGSIVWFAWAGVVMLRSKPSATALNPAMQMRQSSSSELINIDQP